MLRRCPDWPACTSISRSAHDAPWSRRDGDVSLSPALSTAYGTPAAEYVDELGIRSSQRNDAGRARDPSGVFGGDRLLRRLDVMPSNPQKQHHRGSDQQDQPGSHAGADAGI